VAPWTLVEANDKNYARVKVLRTLCERIEAALEGRLPTTSAPLKTTLKTAVKNKGKKG
jgi:hypothetical protein